MTKALLLTIAMPAFNEAGAIEDVVRSALAVLDRAPAPGEVLVVDDGSTDETPNVLERLAAEDPRLRVFRHQRNLGISAFNRAMLREARGEWVFFTSSDGEFDCGEALRFLDLASRGRADAVLGWRQEKLYTGYRLVVSWSFRYATRWLLGFSVRDAGSIRLLRRERFAPLRLYSTSAFINAERLVVAKRVGAQIVETPTSHHRRLSGRGRGAQPRKVLAAALDLLRTRLRFFRFRRYYG